MAAQPSPSKEVSTLAPSPVGKSSPSPTKSVGYGSSTIIDYRRFSVAVLCSCFVVFSRHDVVSPLRRSHHNSMQPQRRPLGLPHNITVNDRSRRRLSSVIQLERTTYKLPYAVDRNLVDWNSSPANGTNELPLFWDVALSGGTHAIKVIYAQCYHLVVACEMGKRFIAASENQDQLRVVTSKDGRKYASVDTITREGIKEASQLGFAKSTLTDLMITPFLLESAESLFDAHFQGRMFSVFRHPVHRSVRLFYATKNNSKYSQWSIDEYARSSYAESNGMVRSLTHKMMGAISSSDTAKAKELLGRKCLVGLAEDMAESFARFHQYFGFGDPAQLKCVLEGFASTASNSHPVRELDISRDTWMLLAEKNWADMRLYEYVQQLFMEQGKWLKRNKKM